MASQMPTLAKAPMIVKMSIARIKFAWLTADHIQIRWVYCVLSWLQNKHVGLE